MGWYLFLLWTMFLLVLFLWFIALPRRYEKVTKAGWCALGLLSVDLIMDGYLIWMAVVTTTTSFPYVLNGR